MEDKKYEMLAEIDENGMVIGCDCQKLDCPGGDIECEDPHCMCVCHRVGHASVRFKLDGQAGYGIDADDLGWIAVENYRSGGVYQRREIGRFPTYLAAYEALIELRLRRSSEVRTEEALRHAIWRARTEIGRVAMKFDTKPKIRPSTTPEPPEE